MMEQNYSDDDSSNKQSETYFEKLGEPAPHDWGTDEFYRFDIVRKRLRDGSVLDIGVYDGDFLSLLDDSREIYGTEVNETRVEHAKEQFSDEIIEMGFRNGDLSMFETNSVDNVVCMETLEHIPNHQFAVKELCRVSKKRVLVTVPYNQKIKQDLCIHCHKYTPRNGHVNSYKREDVANLTPKGWEVTKAFDFASPDVRMLARRLPKRQFSYNALRVADRVSPKDGSWLFAQIDRL